MEPLYEFGSNEFNQAVAAAGRKAFLSTLAAGLSDFYRDKSGLMVMEQPEGQRFEIRWIPGAPAGSNYEVIQALPPRAA